MSLTAEGSPDLPGRLSNLGAGLRDRYVRTGELSDLEAAIEACRRAVSLTPEGSPDVPRRLNNLGSGLRDRYVRTGELSDLERAIEAYRRAVSLTAEGSPDLPGFLNNLGSGLRDRYVYTGELSDLEGAFGAYGEARTTLDRAFSTATVAYKLGFRRVWGGIDARLVETALHLKRVAPLNRSAHWRQEALVGAEGAKSRLLTELLGRGDIPAPPSIPSGLAGREAELVQELIEMDAAELARVGQATLGREEPTARLARIERRGELAREVEELWKQMAGFGPEAAEFVALRRGHRPGWEDLCHLAVEAGRDTIFLSLFSLADRAVLFILRAGSEGPEVTEIPLDREGQRDVWRRFRREVHRYDGTGRRGETWSDGLVPLLEAVSPSLEEAKRGIFAPQAFGHLLPWAVVAHRAGLDLSCITIPALSVLPRLWQRPAPATGPALVVGNPRGDLPYAEREAQEVAEWLDTQPLIGPQATREAVLERLLEARIAHFATHAYFAPGSPLDSGIVLADGVLTGREAIGLRARPALLVLSACETGMATALGGDEMAGLAQAFLQAGATSLLVSLWTVNDPATAALMTVFYDAWLKESADKAEALRRAIAETRRRWPHTYYWGAFTLVGDWR